MKSVKKAVLFKQCSINALFNGRPALAERVMKHVVVFLQACKEIPDFDVQTISGPYRWEKKKKVRLKFIPLYVLNSLTTRNMSCKKVIL